MDITLPVYVMQVSSNQSETPYYLVRPLFFLELAAQDEKLSRATNKLQKLVRELLHKLDRDMAHDQISRYTYAPDLEDHQLKITIDLGHRRVHCKYLFVTFESLNRRLAFTPSVPDLWFEVARGESLADRAVEALTRYFRDLEKKEGRDSVQPEADSLSGKAWLTAIDLQISLRTVPEKREKQPFAMLGGGEIPDGESELHRIGRSLDNLYPDELDRVICRDREIAELTRLLYAKDRRPVLLLGPRRAGKTALIHEFVYRNVEARRAGKTHGRRVWLLSPQRLISGMSYVGQWENRLLAILKAAEIRDHILYFDDLLGLFQAGVSANSTLNVMHVLKPRVERGEFQLLGEITPEAFRIFQEQDRGFADQFQILPVNQTNEADTLRILISFMRQLERQYFCRFELDVLPTAINLQRRYVRDAAFPGNAATFLRQLAIKFRHQPVLRWHALSEFQAKTGLAMQFVDDSSRLDRRMVQNNLAYEVVGQPTAIAAAVDVVCIAKARLNDPDRPLASFLFLGPTGVGKTQAAKSLARFLFGDAEKIIRFDMNEFITSDSVSRLVGTFNQPEGLLTSAVRRQPFSVVLLDEIEKADPDVFNLLLQVMGDGRLTDAMGRTVDFTNTILIMTSNLGVKEAGSQLGFRRHETSEASIYVNAAERFFRPEFFNRLDRIVPFERLTREDVEKIAWLMIYALFSREGFLRRKTILLVSKGAIDRLVKEGYHPLLGARALKRVIERQLTQQVAAQLVSLTTFNPAVMIIYPSGDSVAANFDPLTMVKPTPLPAIDTAAAGAILTKVEARLDDIDDEIARNRPTGAVDLQSVQPEQYRYFVISEQLRRARKNCQRLAERLQRPKQSSVYIKKYPSHNKRGAVSNKPPTISNLKRVTDQARLAEILYAEDIPIAIQELANSSAPETEIEQQLGEILRETALLQLIVNGDNRTDTLDQQAAPIERVALFISSPRGVQPDAKDLLRYRYEKLFGEKVALQSAHVGSYDDDLFGQSELFEVKGAHAVTTTKLEEGTHLFFNTYQPFLPIEVMIFPLSAQDDAFEVVKAHMTRQQNLIENLTPGAKQENPFHFLPVIRIYLLDEITLDIRSGLLAPEFPSAGELRVFLLSALQATMSSIIEPEQHRTR